MNIEIKKSEKPIEYNKAIEYLENRNFCSSAIYINILIF